MRVNELQAMSMPVTGTGDPLQSGGRGHHKQLQELRASVAAFDAAANPAAGLPLHD
jgi:hypothetical protein